MTVPYVLSLSNHCPRSGPEDQGVAGKERSCRFLVTSLCSVPSERT